MLSVRGAKRDPGGRFSRAIVQRGQQCEQRLHGCLAASPLVCNPPGVAYADIKRRLDAGEVLLLDGGVGTELERRGADMDPAAWCGLATRDNEALLTQIHVDYAHAGSDVITANTFASSRVMLSAAGHGDDVVELNQRAVEAALRAKEQLAAEGRTVAVAGSLSHLMPMIPGTATVDPELVPTAAAVGEAFAELAEILRAAGVDLILLEMMYEPGRAKLAVDAAVGTGLPVWFGMSARRGEDGSAVAFHHFEDIPLDEIARLIPATAHVAGAMHTPSELMGETLAAVRAHFDGPMSAYPDSGYFEMPGWRFVDIIEPAVLESFYAAWMQQGARVLGGCCGLTVPHIEAAARARAAFGA